MRAEKARSDDPRGIPGAGRDKQMNMGEIFMLIFILILVSLLVRYYKGAGEIIRTSGGVLVKTISTLQMR